MSARTSVLSLFALWSILCSWWYVCEIKQVCGPRKSEAQPELTNEIAIQPVQEPAAAPPVSESPAPTTTENAVKPQENNASVEKVSVQESGDDATIHFPYNSTQKEENSAIDDYLSRLANHLSSTGKAVVITGHTDGIGDAKTNLAFAERRAKNIRDILVAKGVGRNQIKTRSFGESKPLSTNDTPEGRYQNRRVEIVVEN